MKITITETQAMELIRKAFGELPFEYELVVDFGQATVQAEPVKDIDWAKVERERVKESLLASQQGFDGEGKIFCPETMTSDVVLSFVQVLGGIPHILSYPAYQWFGTTYQKEHDEQKAKEKSIAEAEESARVAAAKQKIQAEVDANTQKSIALMRSERYEYLNNKYGERCDDYEQWKIWEEEEEEFTKLKTNEAADIQFYTDAGIPIPFTPKYQSGKDSIFRIDGMSSEEFSANQRKEREAVEKEQAETLALLDANPDLVNELAGKEPSELFKQLEEAKKAKPVTAVVNSLFQPVAVLETIKEVIDEVVPVLEGIVDSIPVPDAVVMTPFAGFIVNTPTVDEPVKLVSEEVPVFMVDDHCPWDDLAPVVLQ